MSDDIADSAIHAMKHTTQKLAAGRARTTESQVGCVTDFQVL